MSLALTDLLDGLPASCQAEPASMGGVDARFISFDRSEVSQHGGLGGLKPQRLGRFLALRRKTIYAWWMIPQVGGSPEDLSQLVDPAQFLLWPIQPEGSQADAKAPEGSAGYALLLPIVDEGIRADLLGEAGGSLSLRVIGEEPDPRVAPVEPIGERATLLMLATGADPYALCRNAVKLLARRLRTFRTREEKTEPDFVNWFGWCTWDAFYREVDHDKVLAGLETFRKGELVPKFVLLDDGWQDTRDKSLHSLGVAQGKFPDGLAGLIRRCKDEFGVEIFGVWHTLNGYWCGVTEDGPIGQKYRTVRTEGPRLREPLDEQAEHSARHIVAPDDVHRFYQDWYAALRRWGVDMVKVDNQSSLESFTQGQTNRVQAMRAYQWAMQGAAQTHLRGNLLHCMSNLSEIAYHTQSSLAWRNSDDFFPLQPITHPQHVWHNAMNNLWTAGFALPDWDMFQSSHEAGAFHAAARAISGGPVYVSDKPGEQDFELLHKLCTAEGWTLRCDGPAMPTADCLFDDFTAVDRLLKVFNFSRGVGMLGLFHCRWKEQPRDRLAINGRFGPPDLPGLTDHADRFAVYLHQAKRLFWYAANERGELSLPFLGFEIVRLAPQHDGRPIALGLLDKLNGPAAILGTRFEHGEGSMCHLRDGGIAGFACPEGPPRRVWVNGRETPPSSYSEDSGLLRVPCPSGSGEVTIHLQV